MRMHPWTKAVHDHMLATGELMRTSDMIERFGEPVGGGAKRTPWDRMSEAKRNGYFEVAHVGDHGANYYRALPKETNRATSKFSDDDKLRRLWPVMGIKCMDHFPERKDQIKGRARYLGLEVARKPKAKKQKAKKPITYFGELSGFRPTSVFELARFV